MSRTPDFALARFSEKHYRSRHEHPLLATIITRYGGFQNLRGFVAKHLPIHGRV
jgi:hypothetical protein